MAKLQHAVVLGTVHLMEELFTLGYTRKSVALEDSLYSVATHVEQNLLST